MIVFSAEPINSSESGYHSQRSQNKKAMPSGGAGLDGERGEPMDRSGLNVVQWKIKPGGLTSAVASYSFYFLPTTAGNGVLSP